MTHKKVAKRKGPVRWTFWTFAMLLPIAVSGGPSPQDVHSGRPTVMSGLFAAAEIIRDSCGIAHLRATNDHDLFFLQGYVHAQDRLFQMDFYRHVGGGTLAELVGTSALAQDVQIRTLGFRRAAERSWTVSTDRVRRVLEAYAEGVNAWTATHGLPPEYGALGIDQVDPWQPLDSLTVAKLLMWQQIFTDFDLPYTVALVSYRQAGAALGFDGTKLFFEDLIRSAPFESAATIPDASMQSGTSPAMFHHGRGQAFNPETLELIKRHLRETEGLDIFRKQREGQEGGSNTWVVSGNLTRAGSPLLANDPHVDFLYPTLFYPVHQTAGAIDVTGQSFPGIPAVFAGHNDWMSWGSTATGADTLDYYSEQLVPDASSPSGLSTLFQGSLEKVIPIPQIFRVRKGGQLETVPPGGGIPAVTLVVPRRNNGPIIQLNQSTGAAISMQWAEFSGSHEIEAMLIWAEARTPEDFERGIRRFTFPQNFSYIDRSGNFGYYMSGELPVREDLQGGTVVGLPPWFLRNGQGGNEWAPVTHPQPDQALPYEIIPFEEMPHVLNPAAGWVVNGNNDPAGVTLGNNPLAEMRPAIGIYYLGYVFTPGQRAARISELIKEKIRWGSISFEDMQKIQADTVILDARFFVPYIVRAFDNAMRAVGTTPLALQAVDPAITEAVLRLRSWDFTAPTGIPEGYDAFETFGHLNSPSSAEIANSVSATIFAMWRSRFVARVIDERLASLGLPQPDPGRCLSALRHLLESFPLNQGLGASGFDFFPWPGVVSASDRRDLYILRALKEALALLASDNFKNAFGNSTNQNDYRWGKLNRLVMPHPLGSAFSVPPAGGRLPSPLPNLPGIPVDGGFATVDPAGAVVRANNENSFVFRLGPLERSVAEALPHGIRGVSSLGGGISGVIGSPFYVNLLTGWLTNTGYYDQYFGPDELRDHIASVLKLVPPEGDIQ